MKWKNGLGETAEITIYPPAASLDAFDWRISMARVEADGPFSPFAGVDRTLAVLSGSGIRLIPQGRAAVDLDSRSDPYSFPADIACTASLGDGGITDLNVMTRRGRCWHRVRRIGVGGFDVLHGRLETVLVAPGPDSAHVRCGGQVIVLALFDAIRLGSGPRRCDIAIVSAAGLLLVEIGAGNPEPGR
jgi:environmental stress-induced protein Ves